MKLSERLEAKADEMDRRLGVTNTQSLLREAAALARRVEGAPVRMVGEAISYGVSAAGTGISNGQRVRLVPEAGQGGGE